jgi:UDP-2-acetamido-2,6-beta-L-arabino-hexul-4-ose reductase
MTTAFVIGARGFVGRNLCVFLRQHENVRLIEFDVDTPPEILDKGLHESDVIFHLAGVNRPEKEEDFTVGNVSVTKDICDRLQTFGRAPIIIFSSSIQAELDNPYGISKRKAEEVLMQYGETSGATVIIFRIKNIFGKWCRPNYNSVVATFCHNIVRDLPIIISDPDKIIELVHIDDVCSAMMNASGLYSRTPCTIGIGGEDIFKEITPVFKISLGELAETIKKFKNFRANLRVPEFDDPFIYRLYATYLSYLDGNDFAYGLDVKTDARGSLAEFLKSESFGQVFISRTKPGITRGNHYHHTKAEKFFVVQGKALIRFRHIQRDEIIEHAVSGEDFRVVDIPPGYTHSIENVGNEELVTIFWANEIFDQEKQDTFFDKVVNITGDKS